MCSKQGVCGGQQDTGGDSSVTSLWELAALRAHPAVLQDLAWLCSGGTAKKLSRALHVQSPVTFCQPFLQRSPVPVYGAKFAFGTLWKKPGLFWALQDTSGMGQATLSVQRESTGGAGTAFGAQISPLFIQKIPNPRHTQSHRGCGAQTQPPVGPHPSSRTLKGACAPHKKQFLPMIGAGNGISPDPRGLGGAGEAHRGCVSEAAESEPA